MNRLIVRKWKSIGILLILVVSYLLSLYLNYQKVYDYEEIMNFIASCGSLARADFSNTQRGQADYFIVILSAILVFLTLTYSLKYLIKPNEKASSHIKYQILEENEK